MLIKTGPVWRKQEKGDRHSVEAIICNETKAIQLQLREEEWSHDDDDEQGGSLFHWRLFFCFVPFLLQSHGLGTGGRLQTARSQLI